MRVPVQIRVAAENYGRTPFIAQHAKGEMQVMVMYTPSGAGLNGVTVKRKNLRPALPFANRREKAMKRMVEVMETGKSFGIRRRREDQIDEMIRESDRQAERAKKKKVDNSREQQ